MLMLIGIGLVAAIVEVALVRTYQKNKIILSAIGNHWIAVGARLIQLVLSKSGTVLCFLKAPYLSYYV